MAKVTIRHVAELAGVSSSTVSRTLHNHPRISDETKRRVLDAARELNYRSRLMAPEESVRSVGIVLPSASEDLFLQPFLSRVLRGISVHAQSRGYLTTYAFANEDEAKLRFLSAYVESNCIRGVILLSASRHDRAIELLSRAGVPFSVIGRPENPADTLWVDNDNFHAMYDVVHRLTENGARRIAFIGGPPLLNVTNDRLEGYRKALENRGLEQHLGLIGYATGFSESAGYRTMQGILASELPDAVVATDDLLGCGALEALSERRLSLPCVGFNNSAAASRHVPGLSSVEIQPSELGRHAARLLIERIEHGMTSENHVIVPTHFVPRDTTDKVSA